MILFVAFDDALSFFGCMLQYFDDVSPLLRELPHFWLFFAPVYSPSYHPFME
jgi:hypothetical protein